MMSVQLCGLSVSECRVTVCVSGEHANRATDWNTANVCNATKWKKIGLKCGMMLTTVEPPHIDKNEIENKEKKCENIAGPCSNRLRLLPRPKEIAAHIIFRIHAAHERTSSEMRANEKQLCCWLIGDERRWWWWCSVWNYGELVFELTLSFSSPGIVHMTRWIPKHTLTHSLVRHIYENNTFMVMVNVEADPLALA